VVASEPTPGKKTKEGNTIPKKQKPVFQLFSDFWFTYIKPQITIKVV
jgi:hypothetical protein